LACQMILKLSTWTKAPILVVTDSWFGNGQSYIFLWKQSLAAGFICLRCYEK
jgi:hypothetical protein